MEYYRLAIGAVIAWDELIIKLKSNDEKPTARQISWHVLRVHYMTLVITLISFSKVPPHKVTLTLYSKWTYTND